MLIGWSCCLETVVCVMVDLILRSELFAKVQSHFSSSTCSQSASLYYILVWPVSLPKEVQASSGQFRRQRVRPDKEIMGKVDEMKWAKFSQWRSSATATQSTSISKSKAFVEHVLTHLELPSTTIAPDLVQPHDICSGVAVWMKR